jgi:hypothetical protein
MSSFLEKLIPYVIFDILNDETIIEYGSAPENELNNCLINHIKRYMELHEFDYDDDLDSDNYDNDVTVDNKELTCDECECRVVSKKYITVLNDKKLCGSCNSAPNNNIIVNKETFNQFTKFLKQNREKCDIIYFKDDKWCDFKVS